MPKYAVVRSLPTWQTTAVADEIAFSFLAYKGSRPVLAGCALCGLKFLTPPDLGDSQGARDYLWTKYHNHQCAARSNRAA